MAKLILDDFYDDAFQLLAIHSRVSDFKLAFSLNKYLGIQLKKRAVDLDMVQSKQDATYPIFEFESPDMISFFLVGNRCVINNPNEEISQGLFDKTNQTTLYLLPELKTVDYFLKIEPELSSSAMTTLLKKIKDISFVQTVYTIHHDTLKSKNHLNFDEWTPQKELK